MAAYAYLELFRHGAKYLSYTLVRDDKWRSRRTAESLDASCAPITQCTREISEIVFVVITEI
jgi:hypothetical protein